MFHAASETIQVAQDLLDHQLRPAIRVGRRERHVLGDRHGRGVAVHGRRRAEHQVADAVRPHGLAQHQRAGDVVVVVAERDRHRLAHRLEAGEVNDSVNLRAGERGVQGGAIQQINPVEDQRPARELLDPAQRLRLAVAQVIDDDDLVAGAQQLQAGVAADVTGSPGDENPHLASRLGDPHDGRVLIFRIKRARRSAGTLYRKMLECNQLDRSNASMGARFDRTPLIG